MDQSTLAAEALASARRKSHFSAAAVMTMLIVMGWGAMFYIDRTTRYQDELRVLHARLDSVLQVAAQTRASQLVLEKELARRGIPVPPEPVVLTGE